MPVRSFVPDLTAPASVLNKLLLASEQPEEFHCYAAFMRPSVFHMLEPGIQNAREVGVHLGLDIPATPQETLIDLLSVASQPNSTVSLYQSRAALFHPKVYVSRTKNRHAMVLGSSNPSLSALGPNVEANLLVEGEPGSPEAELITTVIDDLDKRISAGCQAASLRRWDLPGDPLPTVKPRLDRILADVQDVAATVVSDGWEADPGYGSSELLASWSAPVSGIYNYADDTGRQGGVYIPAPEREIVTTALAAYGVEMDLCWRFATQNGATIFSYDQRMQAVKPSGRGPGSHNLAITASRPTIARPVTKLLRSLGVAEDARFNVEYRLDITHDIPRLWLIHTVDATIDSIDPSEVVS